MDDFVNDIVIWFEECIYDEELVECEIGFLIVVASAWTEDETELGDFFGGLVEFGCIGFFVG